MKKIYSLIMVILLSIFLSACTFPGGVEDASTPTSAKPTELSEPEIISVFALGDNLLHMPVVDSCKQPDGTYDFSNIYENLQPEIKNADLAVIGQETVFAGEEYGYSGYPLFNSPSDAGRTMVKEGFDVVLHASNHALDKWDVGIENTLDFWEAYPEITVLGFNRTEPEQKIPRIINVKGAEIALLNYTYGTNGFTPPAGKEHIVNYIDPEKIQHDAEFAEKNADFTIAFMHWGTEDSTSASDSQVSLAMDMCRWGVDLIIGAHPHVIEPMEWIADKNGNKTLVYYSLGNFVSRQLEATNIMGAIADVKLIVEDGKVSVHDYSFVPIVTHYESDYSRFDVYKLKDYNDELAKRHGIAPHDGAVSIERWKNIVTEIFEGYDMSKVDM